MPSAPDWEKNPARPSGGSTGASEALSRTAGSVLTTPRQFGPTTRMPCARDSATSSRCAARPCARSSGLPRSPKPPVITTIPRACAAAQSSTTSRDRFDGHSHDRQVHAAGDVADPGMPGDPGDGMGTAVDRVGRPREPRTDQVAEQGVADLVRVVARAHDGDGPRAEQALDRARLGMLLALAHDRLGHRGLVDGELQRHLAVLLRAGDLVTGVAEHAHHPGVLGEHDRMEPLDAALARRGSEMLEQDRADPAALVGVRDDERHLGLVGVVDLLVAADGDDRRDRAPRPGRPGSWWSTWVYRNRSRVGIRG